MVLALKGVSSCTDGTPESVNERFYNKILNGGCTDTGCYIGGDYSKLTSRCQRAQADYIIEFLGFVFGLAVIVLGWLLYKRGGGASRASYV